MYLINYVVMDNFNFPYQPYSIQRDLMQSVLNCIQSGNIGIFESPTGTGKSLSLLCATIGWLRQYEHDTRIQLETIINQRNHINDDVNDDDWIGAYARKRSVQTKCDEAENMMKQLKMVDDRLEKCRNQSTHINTMKRHRNRSPTAIDPNDGDSDGDDDLAPTDDDQQLPTIDDDQPQQQLSCTKIFYCSRTHSQLEQLTVEMSKITGVVPPRAVTIGSRQVLCVNDAVRRLNSVHLMNEKCMQMKDRKPSTVKSARIGDDGRRCRTEKTNKCSPCPFYRSDAIEQLADNILAGAHAANVDQLTQIGRNTHACPYFASRSALALCQIVFLPYQVLLHEKTRRSWGIDITNNVLVLDEAHNLLQALSSVYSADISRDQLSASVVLIRAYIDRFRLRFRVDNLMLMRQLLALTVAFDNMLNAYANRNQSIVLTVAHFLTELQLDDDINLFKLLHFIEKQNLCKKLHGYSLRYDHQIGLKTKAVDTSVSKSGIERLLTVADVEEMDENGHKSPVASSSSIYQLREFIDALTGDCDDGRVLIRRNDENSSWSFRFILLNPAAKLRDIVQRARAVILAGGTMEPSAPLIDALTRVCQLPSDRIHRFSCGHIIDDHQLLAVCLSTASNGRRLLFDFASRTSPDTMAALAMSILNVLRLVPHGVVVFFPSYDYVDQFVQHLKSTGTIDRIRAVKSLFCESRKDATVWSKYCHQAKATNGAVLFAVVGGKLSEGINFSDELGRCVIMVGLPYPNKNSIELQEKMKYLESHVGRDAGRQLYESLCANAVNQAIGRVIRHRRDYAAVILIDERYAKSQFTTSCRRGFEVDWLSHPHLDKRSVICATFFNASTHRLHEIIYK